MRILRDGLRQNGIEVIECRNDVWGDIQDKSQIKGAWRWLRLLTRILVAYPALIGATCDCRLMTGCCSAIPAIPDIFVIRLLAWCRRTRVALDWFLSAYDTVVLDRRLVGQASSAGVVLWWLKRSRSGLRTACSWIRARTRSRMESLFRLPPGRCGSVWVGAEDATFRAAPWAPSPVPRTTPLQVLFYGQFIPLHGIPTIIEAARLLRDAPVDWLVVGRGQEHAARGAMLEEASTTAPAMAGLGRLSEDLRGYCGRGHLPGDLWNFGQSGQRHPQQGVSGARGGQAGDHARFAGDP